eukprot:gene14322-16457_t
MKLLLVVLTIALASAFRSKRIAQLTTSNFNETVSTEQLLLVSFNAPWCAHCKKLTTELNGAAEDLAELSITAKLATVDVSAKDNEKIAAQEGIKSYPTMLVYKDGKRVSEYFGNRAQKDIVQYLRHKASPTVRRVSSMAEITPYLEQFESGEMHEQGVFSILLGLFMPPDENDPAKGIEGTYAALFNRTAAHYDLSIFLYTDEPALLAKFNVEKDGVAVFQEWPEETHDLYPFTPTMDENDIISFLLREALPLTVPYAPETLSTISYHPVKSQVLIFTNTSSAEDPFTDLLDTVAQDYKGRLLFIEINPEEFQLASYFSIKTHQLPQLLVVNMSDPEALRRYHLVDYLHEHRPATAGEAYHSNIGPSMVYAEHGSEVALHYSVQQLRGFLDAYLQNALSPRLLTEPVAEMDRLNDHSLNGYMENIAGSQFQDKVIDQVTQNSFVFFHAPWCAHCKSLEPVMQEVGRHYLEDPSFMLYRIDGTKNDVLHPGVKIVGYPTLYFFPAHGKSSPLEYDGERTLEAMITFIDAFKQEPQQQQQQEGSEGSVSDDEHTIGGNSEIVVDAAGNAEEVGRQQQKLAEQRLQQQLEKEKEQRALEVE